MHCYFPSLEVCKTTNTQNMLISKFVQLSEKIVFLASGGAHCNVFDIKTQWICDFIIFTQILGKWLFLITFLFGLMWPCHAFKPWTLITEQKSFGVDFWIHRLKILFLNSNFWIFGIFAKITKMLKNCAFRDETITIMPSVTPYNRISRFWGGGK